MTSERPEPNLKRAVLVGVVATLVLTGTALIAYSMIGDVPRGTRVLGDDLGGRSRTEAERELHRRFDARAGEPVTIDLDGRRVSVAPADIGLRLDVDASVGRAIRNPAPMYGGHTVAAAVHLDRARLETVLRARLEPGRVTRRQPAVTFAGRTPLPTYARAGLDLDLDRADHAVRSVWLTGRVAAVGVAERPAARTDTQVDAVVRGPATAAVAAPVTVAVGAKTFTLSPAMIAKALAFTGDDLSAAVDGDRLHAAAAAGFATVETRPGTARISFVAGRPRIRPGTPGDVVDLAALSRDLAAVLPRPAPRRVQATLIEQTIGADLAGLGIQEQVSAFTTYFTGGPNSPRSRNISTIATAVKGAVVRPGETFSLNRQTGERDYDAGYQDAPVIVGGKLEPGVGGGASQFTTTLFNAAYYAGLEDVEHKPHSFYFSRYPAVIESTIFYPDLDLKFRNTTPYGILIDTSTTGRSVTVTMWSTRYYDGVRTERGPRRDITSPPTVYRDPGPKCISSSGLPGFTQDAWRIIRKDGKEIAREKFSWRYDPEPRFVCGERP
jgi:vancomycin resistance protein YoaR